MNKNIIVTIAILCAMLLLIIGFIAFLWWIIHLSKKYGEKLNAVRMSKTLPSTFVLKSSPAGFAMAVIYAGVYTVTFLIFRYILGKANWEVFKLTIQFVLAVTVVGIFILRELLGTIFALSGFFLRKLEIDGQHMKYRNWLGRVVQFSASDSVSYRSLWIGGFILRGVYVRFTDSDGKKRFALIYLSEYSRVVLGKYLEKRQGQGKEKKC